tara:strand:+ start:48356 stop:48952 length:597 start_codon:yes stop_codon:yes gene_type:complete
MFFKALHARRYVALFSLLLSLCAFQPRAHAGNTPPAFAVGDTIEITVQGENDLSGSYDINAQGQIDMPMIGKIKVTGKTITDVRKIITERLSNDYLKNPVVSIKTAQAQPVKAAPTKQAHVKRIYIVGAIKNPGYYTLPSDASHILNIVALAGGYTANANQAEFEIVRNIKGTHYRKKAQSGALEYINGDIIIIEERL